MRRITYGDIYKRVVEKHDPLEQVGLERERELLEKANLVTGST